MTRDEWCHLAAHRTPVLVAMEGIPDAPATLIGWHKDRLARVQFASGKRADVRPARVSFPQAETRIGVAVEAATPTSATNGRWASNERENLPL